MEARELADDPRSRENQDRMANLADLETELGKRFATRTSADWLQRMEDAGVPGGPVLDVAEMHRDPQALARDMVVELDHPRAGRVKTIGLPVQFSATPGGGRAPAPPSGQNGRAPCRGRGCTQG